MVTVSEVRFGELAVMTLVPELLAPEAEPPKPVGVLLAVWSGEPHA
jgi:hypothetical protein